MTKDLLNEESPHLIKEPSTSSLELGQWYWISDPEESGRKDWLGCIMKIGSNYAKLESPHHHRKGHYSIRVLFADFFQRCRLEPNASAVIQDNIRHYQQLSNKHLSEIQAITARLGVSSRPLIEQCTDQPSQSLAVLSGQVDVDQYKTALIKAKNEDLPALFEAVKDANEEVQRWMSAEMLPLLTMTTEFNNSINAIDNRIFNVSLYAGLTEDVVSCRGGEPASFTEKLHIMQRRLYMDEECLLNYRHGGMEFKDIEEFDQWLSLPDNLDRILPFPRCMVAMRVRREQKDRENDGKLLSSWVNFRLSKLDELTFLYIRNGQQLYRMNCDLKFDELIFPDKAMFDQSEPMMVKIFCDRVDSMITRREYEALLAEREEKQAQGNHSYFWDRLDEYKPFDETNPYYDECIKVIADRIKYYNRIAVIVQGLFDRSETLHPHPPVKTWTNEGFEAAIELVYDGVAVLYNGEKPDFEMYRAKVNESLNGNSVVVGQDYYWQTKEAEKECERLANNCRNRSDYRPKLFKPPGNEGPGYVARVDHWKPRTRKAVFSWNRERQTDGSAYSGKCAGDPIRTTITLPAEKLFNISGYTPGDYKQFFRDPRSRGDYVKWAPMLLAAEEYYAGNIRIQEPVNAEEK